MRRRLVALLLLAATVAHAAPRRRAAGPSQPRGGGDLSLTFTFDEGFRVEHATNPQPGIDPTTGDTWLYYEDRARNRPSVATSRDGLTFGAGSDPRGTWRNDPRNTRMPDGTWRRYQWNMQSGVMTSLLSTDGTNFTSEAGTRYAPQAGDRGTIGVYDSFTDTQGGVVLLYIGDMFGLNNVRRAYSRDGGRTFTFDRGNILGDETAGGGPNSYVDEKATRLADGRIRLFTMKQNRIYSFLSTDDGYSFAFERELFRPSDFRGATLTSLNDPVVVRLADGRYRMYVAALRSDNVWVVVSATTQ